MFRERLAASVTAHGIIVGFVALQRLAEMMYGRWNTTRLLARGAVMVGEPGYRWIALLHMGWLAALAFTVPDDAPVRLPFLALYGAILLFRIWVMASLGPYWTTRIVTLPSAPLVRRGPYRFLRHPNYAVVVAELAVVPLIFDAWWIAVAATVANVPLLWQRIALEDRALAARREMRPHENSAA
jgi:methyltransferase